MYPTTSVVVSAFIPQWSVVKLIAAAEIKSQAMGLKISAKTTQQIYSNHSRFKSDEMLSSKSPDPVNKPVNGCEITDLICRSAFKIYF